MRDVSERLCNNILPSTAPIFTAPVNSSPVNDYKETLLVLSNAELHQEHIDCGHQCYSGIRSRFGMPAVLNKDELKCEACITWKTKKAPTKKKRKKTKPPTSILELVEADIAAIPFMSHGQEWYFNSTATSSREDTPTALLF